MTMQPVSSSNCREQMMPLRVDADVTSAQFWARRFAASCGFSKRAQWEVAVAVGEAASNIVKFAGGGTILLRFDMQLGVLELEALDRGPGIHDLDQAKLDGVTEGRRRAEGGDPRNYRGLGLGLGAIHRMTDELRIEPQPGGGTRLFARKLLA